MVEQKKVLDRDEVLRILGQHRNDLATRYGVTRLGIFGSVARGDVTAAGDVDVVLEMENPDLFYLVHIKEELEKALHCPVDVVHYRARMNNFLKKRINQEAVYV
ncbi:MAG TPA: nucleotidyltransferase [Gammaproteobacteria bacterium]|nr:nucleotidyltransferase [Gammaproteobacteria bacterium]